MSEQKTDSIDQTNTFEDDEIKKKFIIQTEKLKLMLQVPGEARTPQLCQEIANIAGQIKFLGAYKNKPDFLELCKNLYVKTFEKRQQIFKQGDQGDAFYVIINGSVKVFIDEPTAYKNFMQLKEIAQLGKGDAFGEISLLYNSKRTATVIANEKSDLLVLEKDAFQEYIRTLDSHGVTEMKTVHLNKLLLFLESLPVFSMFNKDLLVQLCTKCVSQQYPSQTVLLKQEVEPLQMYIIKSGRVKAIKKIKMRMAEHPDFQFKYNPSRRDLSPQYQEAYFEIDELGDGDIFGDYGLLTESESECTYVTSITSEIISISGYHLKRIVPSDILEVYTKSLKRYPDDLDLETLYEEKRKWNNYRKKLLKNVFIEKQNKKGFDKRLRLPELKSKEIQAPINVIDIKSSDNRIYFKYLENKISTSAESKKKVQSVTQIAGPMIGLVQKLEHFSSQQSIVNQFQRKLKKLNINRQSLQ